MIKDDHRDIKVIEIGSYDVNGSIRGLFGEVAYLGVDLIEGPNVDIVCEGDKVAYPDGAYDISISCECFEHNPNWSATFLNMCRMTKEGGLVIFTCASTGRAEHGTTRTSPKSSPGTQALGWDYYKNLTQADFETVADLSALFSEHFVLSNAYSCDLYFAGYRGRTRRSSWPAIKVLENKCTKDQLDLHLKILEYKRREKFIPKPLRKFFRLVKPFTG
jgi:SAM-dependent methyltransferase